MISACLTCHQPEIQQKGNNNSNNKGNSSNLNNKANAAPNINKNSNAMVAKTPATNIKGNDKTNSIRPKTLNKIHRTKIPTTTSTTFPNKEQ